MNGNAATDGPVAGIDVGKDSLEVHVAEAGVSGTFGNDAAGHRDPGRMLREAGVGLVVIEATGRHHRALHRSLL